jgi:hypothetical protein
MPTILSAYPAYLPTKGASVQQNYTRKPKNRESSLQAAGTHEIGRRNIEPGGVVDVEVLRRVLFPTADQEERAHRYECEKSLRGRVGVNIVHKKALSRTDHSA